MQHLNYPVGCGFDNDGLGYTINDDVETNSGDGAGYGDSAGNGYGDGVIYNHRVLSGYGCGSETVSTQKRRR